MREPRPAERGSVLGHVLAAGATGILMSLAFHPADLWWLGWVAFVPWMAWHGRGPRRGTARALMLAYFGHFTAVLWWAGEVSTPLPWLVPFLGMPFVAGLAWTVDFGVHRRRLPGALVWPLAIVSWEILRDQALGLTWSSIGYTQWRLLPLLQSASIFRVHGLSFAVLLVNAAVAGLVLDGLARGPRRVSRRTFGAVLAATISLLLLWGFGVMSLGRTFDEGPRALGLQANISQYDKQRADFAGNWAKHVMLFENSECAAFDADLLVVAETSLPPVRLPKWPLSRLLAAPLPLPGRTFGDFLPRGRGQVTVLGYARHDPVTDETRHLDCDGHGDVERNIAGIVRDGEHLVEEYAKRRIVPFGEYVPFCWGWLKDRIRETAGYVPDLVPGDALPRPFPLTTRGHDWRFSTTICFEVVFPGEFRHAARGSDFIVNISNDGWYRESAELDLVHVQVRFRAIEAGRSIFRVSNTGISTLVDPCGRYVATVGEDGRRKSVSGVLQGTVPTNRAETLYVRFGDGPCLVFPLALGLAFLLGGRSRAGRKPDMGDRRD